MVGFGRVAKLICVSIYLALWISNPVRHYKDFYAPSYLDLACVRILKVLHYVQILTPGPQDVIKPFEA